MDRYGDADGDAATLNLYWTARVLGGRMEAADDVSEVGWFDPGRAAAEGRARLPHRGRARRLAEASTRSEPRLDRELERRRQLGVLAVDRGAERPVRRVELESHSFALLPPARAGRLPAA